MRVIAVIVFLVMSTLLSHARAQTAEERFVRGQKAYEAGKYEEALEQFRSAHEGSNSPNARLYIARSLEKLGKRAEAYEEMRLTVRESTERAAKEPKYGETRDAAAAELALLEPKVGKLVIALADESLKPEVKVNGQPFESIGEPTAVEPGEVVIEATAEGMKPLERRLEVPPGDTRTVTLKFEMAVSSSVPEPDPEPGDEGGGDFGVIRAAGIAVTALGVGGIIAFAVTGSMARSKFSQLEDECTTPPCVGTQYEEIIDEGKKLQTVANVMVGIGAGLVAAGVLMIIFGGPDNDEDTVSEWTPSIDVGPAGASFGVNARF